MTENFEELTKIRAQSHGEFKDTSRCAQGLKDAMRLFGWAKLEPYQKEALDMMAQKVARVLTGNPNEPDHWRDLANYPRMVLERLPNTEQATGRPVQEQIFRQGVDIGSQGNRLIPRDTEEKK